MPRLPINYDKTHFYKIVCKDIQVVDLYVGHTTDFSSRKKAHRNLALNPSTKGNNMFVYKFINDNGGWENFDMVLIETCKCENKLDATRKERVHIETLKATLNKVIPTRTRAEWVHDNQEHGKTYKHEWHYENRPRLLDEKNRNMK